MDDIHIGMMLDGEEYDYDGHIWQEKERYENVTVIISENEIGEIDISWIKQPDTRQIEGVF